VCPSLSVGDVKLFGKAINVDLLLAAGVRVVDRKLLLVPVLHYQ
jgi:hypothetical protein